MTQLSQSSLYKIGKLSVKIRFVDVTSSINKRYMSSVHKFSLNGTEDFQLHANNHPSIMLLQN